MGAEYLSYVKFIATRAPTFFGYTISVLASVVGAFRYVEEYIALNEQKHSKALPKYNTNILFYLTVI